MKRFITGSITTLIVMFILVTGAFASGLITWGGEKDVDRTKEVLTFLDLNITKTQAELDKKNAELKDAEDKLTALEESSSGSEAEIQKLQEQIRQLTEERNGLEAQNISLTDGYNSMRNDYEKLLGNYNSLKSSKDEADLRLDKALSDVEELRIYAEQLESKHK